MESSSYQATLGKMIFGMKVTDLNGNRISFERATGRHFAKWLSAMLLASATSWSGSRSANRDCTICWRDAGAAGDKKVRGQRSDCRSENLQGTCMSPSGFYFCNLTSDFCNSFPRFPLD
jgi:hypothetical protein